MIQQYEEILQLMPQKEPFRFLDQILEINPEGIKATYRFRPDEFFYKGHFQNNPITPGVILLEACAQAGLVAYGIYLASEQMSSSELSNILTVFTDANVDFTGIVRPDEQITITARKIFFRRMKLKVEIECTAGDGRTVLRGTLGGMAVKNL